MGLNSTKSASDPVLSTDYNGLYTALVGTDTAPTSPVEGEPWYQESRNTLYYYTASLFSPTACAGWYKRNVGITATGTASDSAVRIPKAESGQNWVASSGTWGISSNKIYSVTDANGDFVLIEANTDNPTIQAVVSGTLNSATNNRYMEMIFRALDSNNCLRLDYFNGAANLRKFDGGTGSLLATSGAITTADGTNYTFTVVCNVDSITAYQNGTSIITHTLASTNYKYMGYTKCGLRLAKAGAPATAARVSNFYVRQAR
jgi:hypothetical protein